MAGSPSVRSSHVPDRQLVGAQPQDRVVELAGGGQQPGLVALLVQLLDAARHGGRAEDGDRGGARLPVEDHAHVLVAGRVAVDLTLQGGELHALRAGAGSGRRRGGLGRAAGDLLGELAGLRDAVDEPPLDGALAADALGGGREDVGEVTPDATLVDDAGEAAGAGQHAEQRDLGQRYRRGVVVDEHDLVARQRQLVAAARGGAVDRGDRAEAGVGRGVLDAVAGLVGELAEVHLPAVRRRGEHLDVGARAEHAVLGAGDDQGLRLGVLEPDPLDRVVQLDVDAEVVAVHLQLVARDDAAVLGDVQRERGHLAVDGQRPVLVLLGRGVEGDLGLSRGRGLRASSGRALVEGGHGASRGCADAVSRGLTGPILTCYRQMRKWCD